jgi:predicted Fe-Mo cluster-binding NifX family protein
MKIAITSAGTDLNSNVDPRFGRTPYFLIVDTDTMQFEAIENPNVNAMGGAGIQSAQLVANKGVEVVLTGSCGPNAFQTLQAAGTKVITGVVGTVSEAIERYKSGQLNPITGPNVGSHYGMGYGTSQGPGFGMGMGAGMGRGSMNYGSEPMQQPPMSQPGFPQPNPEQELQMLKQQANYLKQQLETISKRIKELENKK